MKRTIFGILFLFTLAMVSSFIPTYQAQVSSPYTLGYYRRTFANLGTPANGRVYYCTDCTQANPCASGGSGAVAQRVNGAWQCGSGTVGATSPGGSNTQVQFNDSSAFGGDAGLTYNKTTDTLTISGSLIMGNDTLVATWVGFGGAGAPNGWIKGQSNGVVGFYNSATTDFTRIQMGGTSSSFNSIGRFGNATLLRNAAGTVPAFADLTACSASGEGALTPVSDSSTATWGATITGGGSNHVLAYCNGTNWTVAGR